MLKYDKKIQISQPKERQDEDDIVKVMSELILQEKSLGSLATAPESILRPMKLDHNPQKL